jgi:hypothetical protein
MNQALIDLHHRHVAAAFERQNRLGELLEREGVSREPYEFKTSQATLTFGKTVRFDALDLGSYADPDDSWLWTWCDPNMNLTEANQKLAADVRALGQKTGIAEFEADGQFSCAELMGEELAPKAAYVLAAIVAGELGFDAYYSMPFQHGRFAVVIRDERLRAGPPDPVAKILATFPQVLGAIPVLDHRAAFIAYVQSHRLALDESAKSVRVLQNGKPVLTATFDGKNRLTGLATT